jgi:hypothetical protein
VVGYAVSAVGEPCHELGIIYGTEVLAPTYCGLYSVRKEVRERLCMQQCLGDYNRTSVRGR